MSRYNIISPKASYYLLGCIPQACKSCTCPASRSKKEPGDVTQSKLVLLTLWQANKSRDKLLGQAIVTLFGKPPDQDVGLMSQRTILPELEFRLLLY